MLAGVSFQLRECTHLSLSSPCADPFAVALIVYVTLAAEFVLRYVYDHPFKRAGPQFRCEPMEKGTKLMLVGLSLESVFLLIRYVLVDDYLSYGFSY